MCTNKTYQPKTICDDHLDIHGATGSVNIAFNYRGVPLKLTCDFLLQGYDVRPKRKEFIHPDPPFARIFLFQTAGGEYKAGGKVYRLVPGRIHLLPPGQPFEVAYHANSELLFFHLHVYDHAMMSIFNGMSGLPALEDKALVGRLLTTWRAQDSLRVKLAVLDAVAMFASARLEEMRSHFELTRKFKPLFDALRDTPPGQLRVKSLADEMGMTRAALSKSFGRAMGMPLKDYLTRLFLKKACERLLYSGMPVAEVATALGHRDAHYFHRAFKKLTGMTPDAYRKTGLRSL